ncbi:splicing factor: suppressor of white-apricot-like protein, partial [Dinothrombium tinctorium]
SESEDDKNESHELAEVEQQESSQITNTSISSNQSQPVPQQNWPSLLPSPPPDIEIIIEKLAQYVAKNGEEFEVTVRKRGEERFEFLNPGNIYHAHYIRKKLQYLEERRKTQAAELKLKSSLDTESNDKQVTKTPVSFCFKEKKSSSLQSEEKSWKSYSDTPTPKSQPPSTVDNDMKKTDLALADKLAAAARDRLSREKQLQEERKRKAAIFLSMVSNKNKELKEESKIDTKSDIVSENVIIGPVFPETSSKVNVSSQSNTSSPREESSSIKIKSDLPKNSAVLPFVVSDEPLKESSR